ncbi:MAG: hypothetical protein ACRBBN_21820 [Methyloligellaceae bacterium]
MSNQPTDIARIENAWRLAAKIVLSDELYLPIFERLDKEVETIRKKQGMLEKAKRALKDGV